MTSRMIVVFAVALARAPFAASSGSDFIRYSDGFCSGSGTVTDTEFHWSASAVGAHSCMNYLHSVIVLSTGTLRVQMSVKIVCSGDGASVDMFWYESGYQCSGGIQYHLKEHDFMWKWLLAGGCTGGGSESFKYIPAMSKDGLPDCLKADLDYVITDSGSSCRNGIMVPAMRWTNPVRSADGSEVCVAVSYGMTGTMGMLIKCVGDTVHWKEYAALDCTGAVLDTTIYTVDKMKTFMDGDCFETAGDEGRKHSYRSIKKLANAYRPVCLAGEPPRGGQ